MLADGCSMYAYPFEGYWKDVGTVSSLWEANMDLLGENPKFPISDSSWRIFSRNEPLPPHFISSTSDISNSFITEGCVIEGEVSNSILFSGVKVERGAVIRDSVIMSNVTVAKGAVVQYSIIDSGCTVGAGSIVGRSKDECSEVTVVGADNIIASGEDIPGGSMISAK